MKKLILLMTLFSISTQAQSPYFDSCASSIQVGVDEYWYCHGDIVKTVKSSPIQSKVSTDKWAALKDGLKMGEARAKEKANLKLFAINKDSCAIQFSVGVARYYRCDYGLFRTLGSSSESIDGEQWNLAINAMSGEDDVLSGCTRANTNEIVCPDGVYKKDVSASADQMVKDIEAFRGHLKERNRGAASEK